MHMVADCLLHRAFEDLVRGGNRKEEVFGVQLPLREESFIQQHLSTSIIFQQG